MRVYKSNNDLYVELDGKIVSEECNALKDSAIKHIEKGVNQVYIDLAKVHFMDSAGLGVLVGLKMMASKNKARLILVSPSRKINEILNVSRLNSIFDILDGADADLLKASMALPEYLAKDVEIAPEVPTWKDKAEEQLEVLEKEEKRVTPKPVVPKVPETPKSREEAILDFCRNAMGYMRNGEYEKAIEAYQEALEIDPEYLPAHNNLAVVYEKKPSWYAKAIEQWEKVLELSQKLGDQKHIDRAQKHISNLKKMF